jgi:hypothetical protein
MLSIGNHMQRGVAALLTDMTLLWQWLQIHQKISERYLLQLGRVDEVSVNGQYIQPGGFADPPRFRNEEGCQCGKRPIV